MLDVKLEPKNYREVSKDLDKAIKRYRYLTQLDTATLLEIARAKASDEIIPNTTGSRNPYYARKVQPPTTGKLTSRTGKLKYMMEDKSNPSNIKKYWKGFGKNIAKVSTAGLYGSVKVDRVTRGSKNEEYDAEWRTDISNKQQLFWIGDTKKRETKRTLVMRFMWENKGRPMFKPIQKQLNSRARMLAERKMREMDRIK